MQLALPISLKVQAAHLEVAISHESEAVAVCAEGLGHGGHKGHRALEALDPEVFGHLPVGILLPLQPLHTHIMVLT